jgi:hypothetical protein
MANRRRGEVPLTLGGRGYTLCLTLGALAELEEALKAGDLVGLAERFATGRPRTGDLLALLGAALRGGGHALDDAEIRRLPVAGDLDALATALGEVLAAAFGEAPAANPPEGRGAESRA